MQLKLTEALIQTQKTNLNGCSCVENYLLYNRWDEKRSENWGRNKTYLGT